MHSDYDVVIGLEVHIQLRTNAKLFCNDATQFGAPPNSQVSPISLAMPGTLPVLNKKAVELALRLGIALHCEIASVSYFDRKHYFYPDLPKGYQTTQHKHPILRRGYIELPSNIKIPIHHIHLEEDAGKSIHDLNDTLTYIDLNRAGMPLLELVTEPALSSGEEAFAFLTELRRLVRWLDVCDGNMEEGSLRCDANISLRPKGSNTLGTKVEVKNLNSIRNVKRAIEAEALRQAGLLGNGTAIIQETRGFDADAQTTVPQREKEDAHDYRYFPCPDLLPIFIAKEEIDSIAQRMPQLPQALEQKLMMEWNLPMQDAQQLVSEKATADYFLQLIEEGMDAKAAANWLNGPIKNWLNETQNELSNFPLEPVAMAKLGALIAAGKLNFSMAANRLLPALLANPTAEPEAIAVSLDILQQSDGDQTAQWINEVLAKMPDKVAEYKKGKKGLMGLFVGEVKKISKGKADPALVTRMLQEELKHHSS